MENERHIGHTEGQSESFLHFPPQKGCLGPGDLHPATAIIAPNVITFVITDSRIPTLAKRRVILSSFSLRRANTPNMIEAVINK